MENINITLPAKVAADLAAFLKHHRSVVAKESKTKPAIEAFLKAYQETIESLPA